MACTARGKSPGPARSAAHTDGDTAEMGSPREKNPTASTGSRGPSPAGRQHSAVPAITPR